MPPRKRIARREIELSEEDREYLATGGSDFTGARVYSDETAEAAWREITRERAAEIAAEFAVPVCWAQRRFGHPGPARPNLRVVKAGR